jgi:DNA-binding transcriptional LysR family regulator
MLSYADRALSLEDLETVLAVTACGQFTRAGEILHRSQPAISRSVQTVEQLVETALLDRTKRPTSPTPAGEEFNYEVRRGLYYILRGLQRARSLGREQSGRLEIGHSTYLDPQIVAYLANIARSPQAGFSAVYHSSWSNEIVARVFAGVWDCGFVLGPLETSGLEATSMMNDPLGVVLPLDHPLARRRKVRLADLKTERLIAPSRQRNPLLYDWILSKMSESDITPNIVQEVVHPQEGILLAAENVGLALTNQSAARGMRKGATVWRSITEPDLELEFLFITRREPRSMALLSFLHSVEKLMRSLEYSSG